MRRIAPWIISASSLLVILAAGLGIISAWSAKAFLTKGINVGLEGIVNAVHTGEAALAKFDNVLSETLPKVIIAVESVSASDQEPLRGAPSIEREKTVLALRTVLLPELEQIKGTAETLSQIILSANETLVFINTLPWIQLPELPTKPWDSVNDRLSALQENAQGLVDLLTQSENSGLTAGDPEIGRNVKNLKNISQGLEDKLDEIKAGLSTVLGKIQAVRTKITRWITWGTLGIFLLLVWISGGQIYLLRHFWKSRSKLSPAE